MCTAELEVSHPQIDGQRGCVTVVIISSVTPMNFNDISHLPETTYDTPDIVQQTNRKTWKRGDTDKVIIILVESAEFITGKAHSAFVSTRSIEDLDKSSSSC